MLAVCFTLPSRAQVETIFAESLSIPPAQVERWQEQHQQCLSNIESRQSPSQEEVEEAPEEDHRLEDSVDTNYDEIIIIEDMESAYQRLLEVAATVSSVVLHRTKGLEAAIVL